MRNRALLLAAVSALLGCYAQHPPPRLTIIGTPVKVIISESENELGESSNRTALVTDVNIVGQLSEQIIGPNEDNRIKDSIPFASSITFDFVDNDGNHLVIRTDWKCELAREKNRPMIWHIDSAIRPVITRCLEGEGISASNGK